MSDLNQDTDKLLNDLISLIERYLILLWNGLMKIFIGIKIMPFFQKHPKILAATIILLCFVTPPIALLWIGLGLAALNNQNNMNDSFIIDKDRQTDQLDRVNIEQANKDLEKFHSVSADEIIKVSGSPLHQLPETVKYCHSVYSLQAAKMAAKLHYISEKHHEHFAISHLTKMGCSTDVAKELVEKIKTVNSDILLDDDSSPFKVDGGYAFRDWLIKRDENIIKNRIRDAYKNWLAFEEVSKSNGNFLEAVEM